ncbi:MAG: hypothetical protein AAB903_02070 [Patescibacteria group bacterium]
MPSMVSAELVRAIDQEALVAVLKERFPTVVSVSGSYNSISPNDKRILDEGALKASDVKANTLKHWKDMGATLIHLIWISPTVFVYYPEQATGQYPANEATMLVLPYVNPDGAIYNELAHRHGLFHQMLAIGRVRLPVEAEELVRMFNLSPEELASLKKVPESEAVTSSVLSSQAFVPAVAGLLFFIFVLRAWTRNKREEFELIEPARPVVAPPPSRRERRREESLPFHFLNSTASSVKLKPHEIEERCVGIKRELEELRSVADEEVAITEINLLIQSFDNKPNTPRRLRMAEHALGEARKLTDIGPALFPEPEFTPAPKLRPVVRFEGRKELVNRLRIDDFLDGLNAECAKTILVILIHPGARDPYFGSHRIWGRRLLRSLEVAEFSRELAGETIAGLVRTGVVLRDPSSRSQWYEASYSIALVGDGSSATSQIIRQVLVLRTEVMQGLRAA